MLWGCHFSNFKPVLDQIPEFEFFEENSAFCEVFFFGLKLDNFEKLCIKIAIKIQGRGYFLKKFVGFGPK